MSYDEFGKYYKNKCLVENFNGLKAPSHVYCEGECICAVAKSVISCKFPPGVCRGEGGSALAGH